jgi:hypothetical protein
MKYQVQIKYTNPAHEHVSLRRRVDTVTRLVEAKSEQEALNRVANQQRALGFMIKEASVVKPEVIKEEVERVTEGKYEDSRTHWETHVAPVWEKHGLSPKFAKAVDAHVKKYGDSQVWNYHGSAGGGGPHWFDSKKGEVKPLRKKTGYEIAESWEISDEEVEQVDEKINLNTATMGDVITDFQDSNAPQFKGKSPEKRHQMAIAAKLSAERGEMSEEVEQIDEAKTFNNIKQQYNRNENENRHTENTLLLATHFGTEEEKSLAQKHMAALNKYGHQPHYVENSKLHTKLLGRAKGMKEEVEQNASEEKRTKAVNRVVEAAKNARGKNPKPAINTTPVMDANIK